MISTINLPGGLSYTLHIDNYDPHYSSDIYLRVSRKIGTRLTMHLKKNQVLYRFAYPPNGESSTYPRIFVRKST